MRVISGIYKGQRLYTLKGNQIRPTSDRVREFIFAFLGDRVVSSRVLDLFAGSGTLGIEAASRGAGEVTFVDKAFHVFQLIRRNTGKLGIDAKIIRKDARSFIKSFEKGDRAFDLIFCDPPYQFEDVKAILDLMALHGMLARDGVVIYEGSSREEAPESSDFIVLKRKIMGDTAITFYKLKNE